MLIRDRQFGHQLCTSSRSRGVSGETGPGERRISLLTAGVIMVVRRTAVSRSRSAAFAAGTAAVVTIMAASVPWLAASATQTGGGDHNVVVCHWSSDSGSYERSVVDQAGLDRHRGHAGDRHGSEGDMGYGCPGDDGSDSSASPTRTSHHSHSPTSDASDSCEQGDDERLTEDLLALEAKEHHQRGQQGNE